MALFSVLKGFFKNPTANIGFIRRKEHFQKEIVNPSSLALFWRVDYIVVSPNMTLTLSVVPHLLHSAKLFFTKKLRLLFYFFNLFF